MQIATIGTYEAGLVRDAAPALKRILDKKALANMSASEANMIGQRLRLDPDYLAELISDESPRIALSNEEKRHYTQRFTQREMSLFRFFVEHITVKRLRQPNDVVNDRLRKDASFVMEFSLLIPKKFHIPHARVITLYPNQMDPDILSRLSYSRNLFDYLEDTVPTRVQRLGTALFARRYDDTISYEVLRQDGTKFEWEVTRSEEFFVGRHVFRAKAYQLLLALRVLGYNNPCVNNFYEIVTNSDIPLVERQQKLSVAMHDLFPDWDKPHVKIASYVDLTKPYANGFQRENAEAEMYGSKRVAYERQALPCVPKKVRFAGGTKEQSES